MIGVKLSAGSSHPNSFPKQWYSKGGYDFAPWLELLDNRKWEFVFSENIGTDEDERAPSSAPPAPVPNYLDDNEESPITLGFLICQFDDEEQWLDFTEADVKMIRELVELSKLDHHQAAALYRLFHAQGDGTDLSKQSFHDCIRHLIPGETISQENQQFLSFMLSKIFFAFDNGNRTVDCTEFSCGFRCDFYVVDAIFRFAFHLFFDHVRVRFYLRLLLLLLFYPFIYKSIR